MKARRETEQHTEEEESMSNLNREQNCILWYPQSISEAFLFLPKFISFIQVSVLELWVPEVCVMVMGYDGIGNYPHFINFLAMQCGCSL